MSDKHSVLTFYYIDEYGVQKEYRTIDITGMNESQINAATARMFGEMHDVLNGTGYETTPIPDSEPILYFDDEEIERLRSENYHLLNEVKELNTKIALLKEMLVEAYGN